MKRRFNWVDFLVIGVIVGIIYIGYSFIIKPKESVSEVPIEVTYRVRGLIMESANGINIGDIFRDATTNEVLGELVEKDVKESYELVETGDGRIIKSLSPNSYDVYLKIRGQGIETDDYIRIGGRDMRIEASLNLKNKLCSITSVIIDIKVLD